MRFQFLLFFAAVHAALLGVDLGQSFLKSTLIAPGIPFEMVLTLETKRKEPLSVALRPLSDSFNEFERFYGHASGPMCMRFPESCISGSKALLGRSYENATLAAEYARNHPGVPSVANSKRGTFDYAFLKNVAYQVEEILAMSLSHIKERAQKTLKAQTGSSFLLDIVVTVPPHFHTSQRRAVVDAAKIAGFSTVTLVEDAVGVAVNYASTNIKFNKPLQYHVVYDMGASGTRATLLRFEQQPDGAIAVETKGYAVDEALGGEVLTQRLADVILNKFVAKTGVDAKKVLANKKSLVKLWQAAEKAKLILSANSEALALAEAFYEDFDLRTVVTRQEYEDTIAQDFPRVSQVVFDALASSIGGEREIFKLEDVDSIILFGGATRSPFVQKELLKLGDGNLISKNVNSDEAAVQGATLRGVILSQMFRAKNINITEHSIYDYSFEFEGNKNTVFPKGAVFGSVVPFELGGLENGERNFNLLLYENDDLVETLSYKNVESEIKKAVEKLSKDFDLKKCEENSGLKYTAYFELDQSRIFSVKNVTVACEIEEKNGFFKDLLKKTEQVPLSYDNSTNSTTKASKSKALKTALSATKEYAKPKPLTPLQRDTASRKLKDLAYKDQIRAQKTELMNTLESELYSLRSKIDDAVDEIENGSSKFTKSDGYVLRVFQIFVSENLEWLEDQMYGGSLKDLKTSAVNKRIEKLNIIESFLKTPIKASHFNTLKERAEKVVSVLQGLNGNWEAETDRISKLFTENKFSKEAFDKDYARVTKTVKLEELNLEKEVLGLTELLEKINEAILKLEKDEEEVSSDQVDDVMKAFDLYKNIEDKTDTLTKLATKLEKEHKRYVKQMEKALDNRLKRRQEKLAKKEKGEADSENKSKNDNTEADNRNKEEGEVIHDEL